MGPKSRSGPGLSQTSPIPRSPDGDNKHRGHPGKTGIGKCTVVLAQSDPPSPELRQREKKTVVTTFSISFQNRDSKQIEIQSKA